MRKCKSSIFLNSCKELKVNVKACQQQANGVDYGVFAIANTFHVSAGADIGRKKIQEDEMNDHLLQCITPSMELTLLW